MLAKYNIEYRFKRYAPSYHHYTDDPVTCVEFLSDLLERDLQIKAIRHNGLEVPTVEFDRMIKVAGGMLASRAICSALEISPDEEHFRFGFAT